MFDGYTVNTEWKMGESEAALVVGREDPLGVRGFTYDRTGGRGQRQTAWVGDGEANLARLQLGTKRCAGGKANSKNGNPTDSAHCPCAVLTLTQRSASISIFRWASFCSL